MAVELNKTKYLVVCVMLILLNHYINGVKAADEPKSPEIGSKAGTPHDPTSQVSDSASKTPDHKSQDSGKGSIATKSETKKSEPKTPDSQVSDSGSKTPDHKSQDSGKGSIATKSETKKSEPKTPDSQVSDSGSKTPDHKSQDSKKGSIATKSETKKNEPETPDSQVSKNGAKPEESGSKAHKEPKHKSETSTLQDPKNESKAPVPQDADNGSKPGDSSVPKTGTTGAGPQIPTNGGLQVPINVNITNGTQNPAKAGTDVPINGNRTVGPLIPVLGKKTGPPQVPCYFIFGDSLVDAGNNNILKTLARADYPPYGIDFKTLGPTGRFSNGKTVVDVMAELLGLDHYIPPSELTNGTAMLQGLNFASAAAGIREETAQHLGDRITMKEQVDNFKRKIDEMAGFLGGLKNTTDYLGKCLFQVGLGSNDYLNNYFVPYIYPTSKLLSPDQYAEELIKQYTTYLMDIYNLGARKIALTGVSQVGCSPNSLSQGSSDGTCVKNINDANEMFNTRLKALVDNLNRDHPDAKFTYINSFGLFQELKDNAATYGFKDTIKGCCGSGKYNGLITCLPGQTPCQNRKEFLFWDAYHPTEATNIIGAQRSYIKQLPTDAYPYDIRTLITL